MSLTDDYGQLKEKFVDDVQDRYESIRPLVLFEDVSIKERARQLAVVKIPSRRESNNSNSMECENYLTLGNSLKKSEIGTFLKMS